MVDSNRRGATMQMSPSTKAVGFAAALLTTVFSVVYVAGQLAEWMGWLGSAGGPESTSTPLGIAILLTPSLLLGLGLSSPVAAARSPLSGNGRIREGFLPTAIPAVAIDIGLYSRSPARSASMRCYSDLPQDLATLARARPGQRVAVRAMLFRSPLPRQLDLSPGERLRCTRSSLEDLEFEKASGARFRIGRLWAEHVQVDRFNPAETPHESARTER